MIVRVTLVILAASVGSVSPATGQIADLLQAMNQGGGWISLDVVDGHGSYQSTAMPVGGLRFDGCFQVWRGHSGEWKVRAEDKLGDGELEVTTTPGEPVDFAYRAGFQAQLDVSVEWSEPRDTTLFMWVGLSAFASGARDVCQPPPE